MVKSENGRLVGYVTLNVRGDRDVVGFVEEAQRVVTERVKLPEGVHLEWSGEFENQVRAAQTLRVILPAVFVLILSFEHRDVWVFNSGDLAIRIEALFLAISSCGAALSLDQVRSTGKFWSAQQRPQWPVRLMQLQLSLIYLAAAQAKLNGNAWTQGTAASYALRLPDMVLLPTPHWFTTSALLMNAVTWGTLAVELSIGILVWNSRLRPWVLAAGVVMHTMMMITIAVGFFSLAVFVLYLAFVPPEIVERLPRSAKDMATKLVGALPRRRPKSRKQSDNSESTESEGVVAEPRTESPTDAGTTADN